MEQIVVIGGGWAGCAAALATAKRRKKVILCERTDNLLGTGLVGGIMRNNGRYTAAEELIAMGAGELIQITDQESCHENVNFPGHCHASLYNVYTVEPRVKKLLKNYGVELRMCTRAIDVQLEGERLTSVILAGGSYIQGDVFIDATGTAGPMGNCTRYGNGCVMCIYRCPTFGPRISITAKCGVIEPPGLKEDGSPGLFSGSCELAKESLSDLLNRELAQKGFAIIPLPDKIREERGKILKDKACQQYALPEYAENLVLLDTGAVKMMSPFIPLFSLRQLNGFQNARYVDPYAGGNGNSVRFTAIVDHHPTMQVRAVENLFCAGEKAGMMVGHTEAMLTGTLAGYNAALFAEGKEGLVLPQTTACGAFIAFCERELSRTEGRNFRYTFSGAIFWDYMLNNGLYSTNRRQISERIAAAGLSGIFSAV
ncbi:MAG: FAD-dependent oxidoreductase [Dethiobacteria bacterium]|jgi:hypothetical protein